jgi:hypothetical protein
MAPPDDDELLDIPPDELLDGPPEEVLDPLLLEDPWLPDALPLADVPLDDPLPDDPPLDDVPEDPPLELSPPELVEPYTKTVLLSPQAAEARQPRSAAHTETWRIIVESVVATAHGGSRAGYAFVAAARCRRIGADGAHGGGSPAIHRGT